MARVNATLLAKQAELHFVPYVEVVVEQAAAHQVNNSGESTYTEVRGATWQYQSFLPPTTEAHYLRQFKVKVYRVGSPGTVTLQIRGVDVNGKPTADVVTYGTFNGDAVTTDTAGEWVTVTTTLAGEYDKLSPGVLYAAVMSAPTGDASNRIRWLRKTPGTGSGSYGASSDSGVTWSIAGTGYAFMFEEWCYRTYLKDRILEIDHKQEPYGSTATIRLGNDDGACSSLSFKGQVIRIGYGAVCAGVNEVSFPPYLWVYAQDIVSAPNKRNEPGCQFIIHAEGVWNKLQRWIAPQDYDFNYDTVELQNKTIKEIADYICELAGTDVGTDVGTLDGKVDTWKPETPFILENTNGQTALIILLSPTKCVLLPRTNKMCLKYNVAGDAVDITYSSDTTHYFKLSQTHSAYFRPMKVTVQDFTLTYTYTKTHADWTSGMGNLVITDSYGGIITSNDDCEFIANALMDKAESEAETGQVVVSMDCLRELYDKVTLVDNRDGTSGTGRVGGLYASFIPSESKYELLIRIGGLQRTLATNIQGLIDDMGIAGIGLNGQVLMPRSIPPEVLQQAMQPFVIDLVFEAKDNNEIFWHGSGGVGTNGLITFADGSTLTVTEKVTASALTLTATHFLYFDLAAVAPGTLKSSTSYADAVGKKKGLVAVAVIAGAEDQKALVLPSKGLLPLLNSLVLSANMILADHIKAGVITADKLTFTAYTIGTNTLDDIVNGTTYRKVKTFTAEPTTPYAVGDLWLAASVVSRCTTARATGAYQAADWMATTLDDIAEGSIYKRVLLADFSADHVALSSVTQAAGYRTTSDTEKGVWNAKNQIFAQAAIPTSILAGDLWLDTDDENKPYRAACAGADQITAGEWELMRDGEVTQLRTDITAGAIHLSDQTIVAGEWYDESGVAIDATSGIDVYGQDMAFTTSKLVGTSIASAASADAGASVEFTTAAVHGMVAGQQVVLRGMSVPAYNGKYTIATVGSTTTFKVTLTYSATSTGYAYQVQCKVGSTGAISAGAGAVLLDATGIHRNTVAVVDGGSFSGSFATGNTNTITVNLDKGCLYSAWFQCQNDTDTDDNICTILTATNSAGTECARAHFEGGASTPRCFQIVFYTGLTSGGSEPTVTGYFRNDTGATKNFSGYMKVTKLL